MKLKTINTFTLGALLLTSLAQQAYAAIALDRTRVIFNASSHSVSLSVSNENKHLPYLAQGWIEDEKGNKITSPLVVLPPVQRIEPGAKSQVKIQSLPATAQLPQDRESLFYFNLREIPPRSDKPNTLQIALQTRIKLFYRPQSIEPTREQLATPWQEKMTLMRQGESYVVTNPTPYYITLVDASSTKGGKTAAGFQPMMVAPRSNAPLGASASAMGSSPVITYVNDYGGRPELTFHCSGNACQAQPGKRNA